MLPCYALVKLTSRALVALLLSHYALILPAQNLPDSVKREHVLANADDPSQFFTRIEVYNELQYYDESGLYLNQAVFRTVLKIGKRFTTRLDIPLVSISLPPNE